MKQFILITGGAGYIGSHMTHYLVTQGYKPEQLIVFDNLTYGHKENLPEGVNFIQGDLLESEHIEKVFVEYNIQTVYHFAAYAYVHESMQNPGKYFHNNILGGLNLLESMRTHNCTNIIFSSTCATYGIPETIPITENTPQIPVNPYGESKLAFEKILTWYDEIFGITSVSLRYFNVGGADFGIGEDHDPETHLIPLCIYAALGKTDQIKIYGTDYETPDGTCIRDYIHVSDLVAGHLKAYNYLKQANKSTAVNLGTGEGTSVREIVNCVKKVSPHPFNVSVSEKRPGDPAVLVASPRKAHDLLGWSATKSNEDIIDSAWNWHNK
jgi:UDP-glucose-4-epimerase GalE